MTELETVKKIRELKQIRPRKDWVVFAKNQVLGREEKLIFFPYFKPAFAGLIAVFMFFGFFSFAQNSLPGDFLYPVKKIAEKSRVVFVSEEEKPVFQLELANKKLEDLTKAPAKNLAPTIIEFEANVSEAAKNLSRIDAATSSPTAVKKIVRKTKELEKNIQKVESLGMVVGGEKMEGFYRTQAEYLIDCLENRTLSEEKEVVLEEMRKFFSEGKYSEVLELYLTLQ